MKWLFCWACLIGSLFCAAQKTPYNVVFDLTSGDTNIHKSVVRWLTGIAAEHKDAQLEVVLYGQSLGMAQTEKSVVAGALQPLLQNKNIRVAVCASAMKRHGVQTAQLLPGITIVPDGIYEIVVRQKEGWGYIKAGQ